MICNISRLQRVFLSATGLSTTTTFSLQTPNSLRGRTFPHCCPSLPQPRKTDSSVSYPSINPGFSSITTLRSPSLGHQADHHTAPQALLKSVDFRNVPRLTSLLSSSCSFRSAKQSAFDNTTGCLLNLTGPLAPPYPQPWLRRSSIAISNSQGSCKWRPGRKAAGNVTLTTNFLLYAFRLPSHATIDHP